VATLCLEDIDQDHVIFDQKLIGKNVEQKNSVEVIKKECLEGVNETQRSKIPTVNDYFNMCNWKGGRSFFRSI